MQTSAFRHLTLAAALLLTCVTTRVLAQGAPHPPLNDNCGAATLLASGVAESGDLWYATDDLAGVVGCQNQDSSRYIPDVWYAFVATGPRLTYTLHPSSIISGQAFSVLVYDSLPCHGAGGHLITMTCGSGSLHDDLNVLAAGRTYYLAVSGTSDSAALLPTFQVMVTTGPAVAIAAQDCNQAVILNNLTSVASASMAPGHGVVPNEVTSSNSCFGAQSGQNTAERQSKWYKFVAGSTGALLFNVSPNTPSDDYDWAIWDITTDYDSCTTKGSALACNWSGGMGSTGLSFCPTQEPGYVTDAPFSNYTTGQLGSNAPITVQIGHAYALLVDNFSASSNGFTLLFGGACPDSAHRPARLGYDPHFAASGQASRTVAFTPVTQNASTAVTYRWTFGDGASSTLAQPTHSYATDGLYTAVLQLTDVFGLTATYGQVLRVGQVSGLAAGLAARTALVLAPNPAHGTVRLTLGAGTSDRTVHVVDALGREVRVVTLEANQRIAEIGLHDLRPGVYVVRVGATARRLVVE